MGRIDAATSTSERRSGSNAEADPDSGGRGRSARRWRALRTLVVAVAIAMAAGTVALGSVGAVPTEGAATPANATDSSDGGPADSALVVADGTVEPDSTASQRVSLTEAPDGLAGFELTLAVDDGDVATIANAGYPDRYGLTSDPVVSDDGETVTVKAADLDDEVTAGATDVTLATVDVTGVDDGETELRVTDLQVDADGGDAVEPKLEAGTLTVGGDGSDSSGSTPGGDTGDGSESDDNGSDSDSDSSGNDSDDDGNGSESDDDNGSDSSGNDSDDSSGDAGDDSVPGFAIAPTIAAIAVLVAAALARVR